jgi:tetratricopeptide (TPR) repeat protein
MLKIYSSIIALALVGSLAGQALSPEAQKCLSDYYLKNNKKIANDPKALQDPQNIFEAGYWSAYRGQNILGEELMQYGLRNIPNLDAETIRHSSVQNTKNGFWAKAIEKLDRAAAMDPEVNGYYAWVMLFFYHDYERSLACFEKYEKHMKYAKYLNANADNIQYVKGIAHMQLGHYQQAIALFERCENEYLELSKKKDFYPFQLMLYKGRCYQKLGEHQKALQAYDKANAVSQVADNYYYKAQVLLTLGQKAEAKESLENALTLIKKNRKHSEGYQEVFDEIYWQEVQEALETLNKS